MATKKGSSKGSTKNKKFWDLVKKSGAKMMDLKFVDMLGTWQHCSYPIDCVSDSAFEEGQGFDGSSIRGWQDIHQSDMMAVCDSNTACLDPFFDKPTVSVLANIVDPETRQPYEKCPRTVCSKAAA